MPRRSTKTPFHLSLWAALSLPAVALGAEPSDDLDVLKEPTEPTEPAATPKKRGRATISTEPLPPDRTTGKAASRLEWRKPWIQRWAPQRDMLELGVSVGMLFVPRDHGLYDAGVSQRPDLNRTSFDFSARLSYMPLSFVGAGIETGVMPSQSDAARTRPNLYTFRVHAIAQLPYRITPTFVIGGGLVGSSSSNPILQQVDGAFHWGLGGKLYLNQWVALRLDGRHIVTPNGPELASSHYGELWLGLDVTLRMRRLIKPRTRDRDHDGVNDVDDACPTVVGDGDDGCPTNVDADRDGIIDSKDRCPNEWGDSPSGCPLPDADNDGLLDHLDQCPEAAETRNGFEDNDGCPDEAPPDVQALTGTLAGITFDSGKTTIRRSSKPALDRVAQTLKDHPQVRIEIIGHTDDQGDRDSNVELSRLRAEAVKAYLVEAGVKASRVQTRGMGPDEPVGDNKTAAGRRENRRIEFAVIPYEWQPPGE